MKMNTSAASENPTDWRVNCARRLFQATWSIKILKRAMPRKKSSRRSRSEPEDRPLVLIYAPVPRASTAPLRHCIEIEFISIGGLVCLRRLEFLQHCPRRVHLHPYGVACSS